MEEFEEEEERGETARWKSFLALSRELLAVPKTRESTMPCEEMKNCMEEVEREKRQKERKTHRDVYSSLSLSHSFYSSYNDNAIDSGINVRLRWYCDVCAIHCDERPTLASS